MILLKRPPRVDLSSVFLVLGLAWCAPCPGQTPATPEARTARNGPAGGAGAATDPVKLSFLFLGCNRIQHSDWEAIQKKDPKQDPSAANLPQFDQTAHDIAQLRPTPPYLFFTGDLVLNLVDDDGKVLKEQLDAWTALFNDSPMAGKVTLIPLPGNHEMLRKITVKKDGAETKLEVPNPRAAARWVDWLRKSRFDTFAKVANGPRKDQPKADMLVDDQGEITYSFDIGDVHFVVINTDTNSSAIDPSTGHPYAGWVPYQWIEQDIVSAQANPKVGAIFVLGHKPILPPQDAEEEDVTVVDTADHPLAHKLRDLLLANDKVRAYLCAHEHTWDLMPLATGRPVWQVIAGNAGSQLTKRFRDDHPFFGFSQINVYTSGKVGLVSYQRKAHKDKDKYLSGPPVPAALPQPEVVLHPAP